MEFKDKVCVVTGGSNGIGKKIIEDFIKAGSKVCFIDIDEKGAKVLIDKYQENILCFKGDISEECTLKDFYKVVKENYNFGFATVDRETYNERELEDALHNNITALLLEMGTGFWSGDYVIVLDPDQQIMKKVSMSRVYDIRK